MRRGSQASDEYIMIHGYSGAVDVVRPDVVAFLQAFQEGNRSPGAKKPGFFASGTTSPLERSPQRAHSNLKSTKKPGF